MCHFTFNVLDYNRLIGIRLLLTAGISRGGDT